MISKVFVFLIIFLIQLQFAQFLSYGLLVTYLGIETLRFWAEKKKFFGRGVLLFFIWLIVCASLTRPVSVTTLQGNLELFWLTLGVISTLIMIVRPKMERKSLIKIIINAGFLGGLLNVFVYLTEFYNDYLIVKPYAGTRSIGGFDSPGEMGAFYCLILALAVGAFIEKEIGKFKLSLISGTLLYVIYLAFSRGALLGVAGAFVVGVFYIFKKTKRKLLFSVFILAICITLYEVAVKWLIPEFLTVRERAISRDYLYSDSWILFSKHPFVGTGWGSFTVLAPFAWNDSPHSDFLAFMVAGGMVGLIFIVGFLTYLTWNTFKSKLYPELLFMLAYISQAFSFNHLIRGRVGFLFWVMVVIIYCSMKENKKEVNEHAELALKPQQARTPNRVFAHKNI